MTKAYQHRKPSVQYQDGIPIIRVYKPGTKEVVVVYRKLAKQRDGRLCKHELAVLVYAGSYKTGCLKCGAIFK